jgi:hypothetical protein
MDHPVTMPAATHLTHDTHAQLVALAHEQGDSVESVLRHAIERGLPLLLQEQRQIEEARRNGHPPPA